MPGKQAFHSIQGRKEKTAAPPDNIPEKLPLINYLFKYTICYLSLYFLHIFTTRPLRASSAMALGITIRPLKKSAKSHTNSSFRAEPIMIQATTNKEYTFAALSPNRYFALIRPKKCQPRIVENAKNKRHGRHRYAVTQDTLPV